jgi:hypothetical protein
MTASQELANKLVTDAYGPIFYWPQHDQTIDKIWSEPGNAARLEALLDDRSAPLRARLIAAEVLMRKDFSFLDRHDAEEVARIYAAALAKHQTNANVWGLLWINDTDGPLGATFAMLEAAAIPALRELLSDATLVTWYEGSEEATLGNRARFRVKDFAAFYLARIVRHPIAFHEDLAGRDAEIAKLVDELDHARPASRAP